MLEFARYEGRQRVKGSAVLAVGLAALTGMYVGMFPTIEQSIDLQEYANAFPEAFREAFNIEAMGTMPGFLATELYGVMWILLLGLYLAYSAASLVAEDVERGRIDVLLSLPVARRRVLVEKYSTVLVPILAVNVVIAVMVAVGTRLVGYPVAVSRIVGVHAFSLPYLLCCAAIGLVASVAFDRASTAQRASLGVVFGLFLVESLAGTADADWLGVLSPMRYYNPTAILVHGRYDIAGAAILLAATAVLLAGSVWWFERKDL